MRRPYKWGYKSWVCAIISFDNVANYRCPSNHRIPDVAILHNSCQCQQNNTLRGRKGASSAWKSGSSPWAHGATEASCFSSKCTVYRWRLQKHTEDYKLRSYGHLKQSKAQWVQIVQNDLTTLPEYQSSLIYIWCLMPRAVLNLASKRWIQSIGVTFKPASLLS